MIHAIDVELTGISPLLMHSARSVDPVDCFRRAIAAVTGKRKKTDEDHRAVQDLEWWAGLYTSPLISCDEDGKVSVKRGTRLVIPAHVCDSLIRGGARKSRSGGAASAGTVIESDATFSHDGPTDLVKLSQSEEHRLKVCVVVNRGRVLRVRPMFSMWKLAFSVTFDPEIIEARTISQALDSAGRLIGIGDWRPGAPRGGNYGRFQVTQFVEREVKDNG